MSTRKPALLRWTEEAEAEQVCALAGLMREPQSASPDPLEFAALPRSTHHRLAVLPRLLSLFGCSSQQIKRDYDA